LLLDHGAPPLAGELDGLEIAAGDDLEVLDGEACSLLLICSIG
jgi:hypothetical protein